MMTPLCPWVKLSYSKILSSRSKSFPILASMTHYCFQLSKCSIASDDKPSSQGSPLSSPKIIWQPDMAIFFANPTEHSFSLIAFILWESILTQFLTSSSLVCARPLRRCCPKKKRSLLHTHLHSFFLSLSPFLRPLLDCMMSDIQ